MNAITTTNPHPLRPQNFSELMEFAKMAARSTLVPRDYLGKPENIVLAIQMGSEIGLAPMQSLQNISVINGRPAVWGDAMLGLCRQSPTCKDVVEYFEGEGQNLTAVCIAKRVGAEVIERRFSMDDAVRAGLASKPGTWQQYPTRMLQHRARGFALRDAFPDVLKGLISREEAEDIPDEKFSGKTIEHAASDERTAINDAVPLKPAAAATPRAERKVDPKPYEAPPASTPAEKPLPDYTDVQWDAWIAKLRNAAGVVQHRQELVEMADPKRMVGKALAEGPDWVKRDISEILAKNYKRFAEASLEEPEAELPEVEIAGERNVMAG